MRTTRILAVALLTMAAACLAADDTPAAAKPDKPVAAKPDKPAATQPAKPLPKPPEVMTEAVDPFEPTKERQRFFTAAGPDSELTAEEFAAARSKKGSFVRKFDTFEGMKKFDGNGNGTIDWFEAKAYREDIRKRVLAAFDANKDGKLAGEERDKANRLLAAGRLPAAQQSGIGSIFSMGGGFDAETVKKFDADGNGQLDRDERRAAMRDRMEQRRAEALAKYDADHDGKLSEDERAKLREEIRGQFMLRAFDKDGDGKFSEAESAEMDKALARFQQRREQWEQIRADMVAKHDANKDGRLTGEERRAAWRDMRQQWATKAFDADGDGKLSEAERAAMEKGQAEMRATYDRWRGDWVKENDADGDGTLSEAEQQAAREKLREEVRKLRDSWMAKWDADKDGQLSDGERQDMRAALRKKAEEIRKELDADGDGRITGPEAQGFLNKLRETYDADEDGVLSLEEMRLMIRDQLGRMGPGGGTP